MKITVEEALKVYEKYGEEAPIFYYADIRLDSYHSFTQGMAFEPSQVELLKAKNIKEIDVIFSEKLLAKLINLFPEKYRPMYGRKSFVDLDRYLEMLEDVNKVSKRKRYVISAVEIYNTGSAGQLERVLEYGQKIDYQKWNEIKARLDRKAVIDYYLSERGIIVYAVLKPTDPNYAQKYYQFMELVTMLVEKNPDINISIAPDFYGLSDVHVATSPEELLEKYKNTNAKLIVIYGGITEDNKAGLINVKTYDKFARMIAITNVEKSKTAEILLAIKEAYNKDPWLLK